MVASRSTISSRIAFWFDASEPRSGPRGRQLKVRRRHTFLMRFRVSVFNQSEGRNLLNLRRTAALACRYFTARSLICLNGLGACFVAVLEPTLLCDAPFDDSLRGHTVHR
jgi:hypothetical protein